MVHYRRRNLLHKNIIVVYIEWFEIDRQPSKNGKKKFRKQKHFNNYYCWRKKPQNNMATCFALLLFLLCLTLLNFSLMQAWPILDTNSNRSDEAKKKKYFFSPFLESFTINQVKQNVLCIS